MGDRNLKAIFREKLATMVVRWKWWLLVLFLVHDGKKVMEGSKNWGGKD